MKRVLLVAAVAGLLSACGTTSTQSAGYQAQVQAQDKATYDRQAALATQAINQAPDWMTQLPKSANAVYATGTAVSSDFSMSDLKAKTIAYSHICVAAGGKVRSQTKMYQSDNGASSVESTEFTARSICPDVDITGVETVEVKRVAEGNRIRTYVLIALPTGNSNVLKSTKDAQARIPGAFKELDEVAGPAPAASQQSKVEGITLLPVDNEDYKAKRDAALQKPGAVIGHTTIQTQ